jgi:Fe-S-cluster containining protein
VPRSLPDPTAALLADLAAVYRDADRLYAGWSCPASTECCRFGMTGREPYVTSIELAAIKKAIAARGGLRSWKRAPSIACDATGSATGRVALPVMSDERRCPLLDAAGRCAVYAARPLGCRTFFCDRAEAGSRVKQRDLNALVRRIQDIAAAHEPGGDKGRPLTRAL